METPAEQKSGRKKKYVSHAHQLAKEYLLANPAASNEEVVKALGVSSRAVSTARSVLVNLGYMQRNFYDRRHRASGAVDVPEGPSETPPGPNETAPSLPVMGGRDLQSLESTISKDLGPALTTEQMRQRYSAIARWAGANKEFTLEISAMQALGRLDAQQGARDKLGPGVPLTRMDKVERISLIMEAGGPSITAESLVRAFERPEIDRFIDELGRFMARGGTSEVQKSTETVPFCTPDPQKGQDGLPTPENRPPTDGISAPEVPSEVSQGPDVTETAGEGDDHGPSGAEEGDPGATDAGEDAPDPSGAGEPDPGSPSG